MDLRALHRRLHELRKESGLSVDEMARRLGVSPMTVERVESGPFTLSVATVADWAAVCGQEVEFVFRADARARPTSDLPSGLVATDALPGAQAHARRFDLPRPDEAPRPPATATRLTAAVDATNAQPVTAPPGQDAPLRQPVVHRTPTTPRARSGLGTAPLRPAPRVDEPAPREPAATPEWVVDPVTGPSDEAYLPGPFRTGRVLGEPAEPASVEEPVSVSEPTSITGPSPSTAWGRSVALSGPPSPAYHVPAEYEPNTSDTSTSETERAAIGGMLPRAETTAPTAQLRGVKPPKLTSGAKRTSGGVIPGAYAGSRPGKKRPQDVVAIDDDAAVGHARAPSAPMTRAPVDAKAAPEVLGALRSSVRIPAEPEPPPPELPKGVLQGLVR